MDSYTYAYNAVGNRRSVTRADSSHVDYGYDPVGQLTSALGAEASSVVRGNENFGYLYDAADNLLHRTNNTLIQTFTTGNDNRLTGISRNSSLTVAGALTSSNAFTVNGTSATIYGDMTFAVTNGVSLADGANTFAFLVTSNGVTMSNGVVQVLPASVNLSSDLNGNLLWDGLHAYEYDCANQLTRITVTNQWKNEFAYDGFGRRRVRKEYTWNVTPGSWQITKEVRNDGNQWHDGTSPT